MHGAAFGGHKVVIFSSMLTFACARIRTDSATSDKNVLHIQFIR